jgi:thiol-disulfide isomerase/thioredoxin/outer membrane lipoprotein-sorting protein
MMARAKALPFRVAALLPIVCVLQAQEPQKDFTDPVALLKAVAKTYTAGADTFHMEAITEITSNADLHHEWRKVYHTAIKGPGNVYRIETRSPYGSFTQVSDGTNEWVYLVEGRIYVKRPLPENWPQFPRLQFAGSYELSQAWSMRTWLESTAASYKHATMLPQETIDVEGRSYPCYVVDATSKDGGMIYTDTDYYAHVTLWIDKSALVFRKQVTHARAFMSATHDTRIPYLEETLAVYPVADFHPQTTPEMFRFAPPPGAKEVPKLEPDFYVPPPAKPKVSLTGQPAPEVSFVAADGTKISIASFRGKPLLLDFWATWCGPCLVSMPALNRIYQDIKDKGIPLITLDLDHNDPDAAPDYLARHNYAWTNYHDSGGEISRSFKGEGIPLTVLIDAKGKIAYYDFGGDETAVRKAIAALGPEFASIATSVSPNSAPPRH